MAVGSVAVDQRPKLNMKILIIDQLAQKLNSLQVLLLHHRNRSFEKYFCFGEVRHVSRHSLQSIKRVVGLVHVPLLHPDQGDVVQRLEGQRVVRVQVDHFLQNDHRAFVLFERPGDRAFLVERVHVPRVQLEDLVSGGYLVEVFGRPRELFEVHVAADALEAHDVHEVLVLVEHARVVRDGAAVVSPRLADVAQADLRAELLVVDFEGLGVVAEGLLEFVLLLEELGAVDLRECGVRRLRRSGRSGGGPC